MAEPRTFDERDYLNVGGEYQSRQGLLNLLYDKYLREEDPEASVIPRYGARRVTDEQRTAALTTPLELPPEDRPFPQGKIPLEETTSSVTAGAPTRGAVRKGSGIYRWRDPKTGVIHMTDRPDKVPAGVKELPTPQAAAEIDGTKLYQTPGQDLVFKDPETGEVVSDAREVLGRAAESDEARESRMIDDVISGMAEKGQEVSRAEATRAFKGARREVPGEPEKPRTYEESLAIKNQVELNIQEAYRNARTPEDKQNVLREGREYLAAHRLDKLKKPEQTVTTKIEGQTVKVPLKNWDPKKHGKGAGVSSANIPSEIRQFEIVTGLNPKERGGANYQKAWNHFKSDAASGKMTREKWNDKQSSELIKRDIMPGTDEFDEAMAGIMSYFDKTRGAETKTPATAAATERKVAGVKAKATAGAKRTPTPTGKVERRRLPDGRVFVKDAQGNITLEG